MIPTENEYTLATHAAAKASHDRVATEREKRDGRPYLRWDDETVAGKRLWLEEVLPIVDATISAIPDRLEMVEKSLEANGESVSCAGYTLDDEGCFAHDVAKRVRAAIKMARP